MLLQKCNTELENMALPNHLQLTRFVPLPFPAPGSAPAVTSKLRTTLQQCATNLKAITEAHTLSLENHIPLHKHFVAPWYVQNE